MFSEIIRKASKVECAILAVIFLTSFILEFSYIDRFLAPVHGNWIAGDQYFEIGVAYFLSGQGLLKNDFVISHVAVLYPSAVFSLLGVLYNIFSDMFVIMLVLTLLLKGVFILSTYLLANYIFKNKRISLLAVFFVSFTHFMGSEEIGLSQLIGKTLPFAFMPLLFYLFLRNYKKYSIPIFIVLGMMAYVHSITVIPVALALLFSLLFLKKDYKIFFAGLAIFSILSSFYFLTYASIKQPYDLDIIKTYSDITFAHHALLSIGKFLAPLLIGLYLIRKENKEILCWIIILGFYSLLTISGYFNTNLLMLQFYRGFKYALFFCFLYSAKFVYTIFDKNKIASALLAIVIFLPFSSIYYSNAFDGITQKLGVKSSQIESAIELSSWIEANTKKDSVFLVPPEFTNIRVWSKRPVVITRHDMALCMYNSDIASRCREMYNDVSAAYEKGSTESLKSVAKKYGANYIISQDKALDMEELYTAGSLRLYRNIQS